MNAFRIQHDGVFLILPEVELALFALGILLTRFPAGRARQVRSTPLMAMLGVIFSGYLALSAARAGGRTPSAASAARSSWIRSSCFSG